MSKVKADLKIDLNNLDKSNWKTYRFDEIVKNISERVDPNNTDLTVYIGLEHIDSESLHIKRHGTPDDVNGTKLKFYKGDIIFGRRRAYQRKAGIATSDGFCSAHALVLRANPDVIDSELFPFFLHSDLFMNRAIDISVGSLSPTINWGTLKHQEFTIPPIEIQLEVIKLLLASDDLVQSETLLLNNLELYKSSYLKDLFLGHIRLNNKSSKFKKTSLGDIPENWTVKKVGEIAKVIRGSSPRPKGDPRYYGGEIPRLMGADVTRDGKYVTPKIDFLTEAGAKLSRPLQKGALVMICSGNVGLSSFLAVDCCIHDGFIAFTNLSGECDPDFLYYTFNSQLQRLFQNATHGGVFTNLTTDIIKNFEIVIPPSNEQTFIGLEVSKQDRLISEFKNKSKNTNILLSSLLNKVF
ncbi:MAG: restriction endonuclease subunit S [Flavobacteriaceae bacterium]|nr:restriction endonuclease subunit S [Flavobacteriaceae bacterium]